MKRKTHILDASDQRLGRLAVSVAVLLRGKQKPGFVPYKDEGDFVVVENVDKLKFTGRKAEQKVYYRHSGYLGGLKQKRLGALFSEHPGEAFRRAVRGMLPGNKLRDKQLKRLRIK